MNPFLKLPGQFQKRIHQKIGSHFIVVPLPIGIFRIILCTWGCCKLPSSKFGIYKCCSLQLSFASFCPTKTRNFTQVHFLVFVVYSYCIVLICFAVLDIHTSVTFVLLFVLSAMNLLATLDQNDPIGYALSTQQTVVESAFERTIESCWTSEEKKELLETLDFDPFTYEGDQEKLILLIEEMFSNMGLIHEFRIPKEQFHRFLIILHAKYRHVPFHNFLHAFNVTHSMYYFLSKCDAKENFGRMEILALLLSCLCHGKTGIVLV